MISKSAIRQVRKHAFSRLLAPGVTMAIVLLLAPLAHAQGSRFLFDASGNLQAQSPELNTAPQINGQPQNHIVDAGETASFSVVATGTQPLAFQWVFDGANIGGATSGSLLLQNVTTNDEGAYQVIVSNASGSVTSAPALLIIDSDHDGMGDSWELTYFGNLDRNGASDFDGDGNSNRREFQDGTDPTDPNSVAYRLTVVRDLGSVQRTPDLPSYTNGQSVTLTAIPPTNGIFHAWLGDLLTRSNPVTVVMTRDKTVYARFTPIVFIWTNTASGDWNTAVNWKPNLAPSTNDTAIINTSVVVTLNTPADCAEVTLGDADSSPTLTGSGTLTVRGKFAWGSGVMSGTGRTIVETGATLNLVNQAAVALVGRALENGGMGFLTDVGGILMQSGAVITNRAGASFELQNGATFSSTTGLCRFDNVGTFRRSFGIGATTFGNGVSFNNYGAVELQTGSLTFAGGGSSTGSFTNPPSLLVEWTGGVFPLNPGAQLNGAGLYRLAGSATVAANANLNVQNLELVSVGATLGGTGTVTVLNAMNWTGGSLNDSGRLIIPAGVGLQIANSSTVFLNNHILENGGTALWTGTGPFVMNSGGTLTNRSGALFQMGNDSTFSVSVGAGRFDNAGVLRKSTSTGVSMFNSTVTLNNYGAVEILSGTLDLRGGSSHTVTSSVTGAGNLRISGGTANFAGLVNVTGSNSFTGSAFNPDTINFTGVYFCTNNTLTIAGNNVVNFNGTASVSPAVVDLKENGVMAGSNTVTVLNTMNWTGGTMSGSGRTIIPPGAILNVSLPGGGGLSGRTLENGGTTFWTGTGFIAVSGGGVVTNRPGALFHVQNAASIGGGLANGRFDSAGTFLKSVSTGTTTFAAGLSLNNFGTVQIQTGTLDLGGGGAHSGSFEVAAGSALILSGGPHNAGANSSITGAGHFTISGGIANLAGFVNVTGTNTFTGFNSFIPDTVNITGNYICTNNTLSISGNRVANFSGTGLVAPAVLNLTQNATLTGANTVTFINVMTWTGGTMSGTGRTIVPPGATVNVAAPSFVDLAARTLENGGTILWTGPGFISLRDGGVITNRAGALFHAQNAVSIGGGLANGRFDNAGTFRKSANAGATTFASAVRLNNYGTVDIRSGILAANGGFTFTSNALLNCALGGTTAGTNYGQLQTVGAVTLNGALSVDLINGFIPATNDVFTVLTTGSRNGAFGSFFYPSNRVTMLLSNSPNSVVLRVTGVLPIPQPILLAPQLAGSNVLLTWTATSNVTYRLEGSTNADLANWIAIPGDVTTLSNAASKLDALTPSNRFYRVRVLP
jgi:hypothetical protein